MKASVLVGDHSHMILSMARRKLLPHNAAKKKGRSIHIDTTERVFSECSFILSFFGIVGLKFIDLHKVQNVAIREYTKHLSQRRCCYCHLSTGLMSTFMDTEWFRGYSQQKPN